MNLYASNIDSQIKGLWCENLVAIYLSSLKWRLISLRKKIRNVEIDMIFKTPRNQIVFVEVKSVTSKYRILHRWTLAQQLKFKNVIEQLNVNLKHEEIYGVLALVAYNEISFFYMDET